MVKNSDLNCKKSDPVGTEPKTANSLDGLFLFVLLYGVTWPSRPPEGVELNSIPLSHVVLHRGMHNFLMLCR